VLYFPDEVRFDDMVVLQDIRYRIHGCGWNVVPLKQLHPFLRSALLQDGGQISVDIVDVLQARALRRKAGVCLESVWVADGAEK